MLVPNYCLFLTRIVVINLERTNYFPFDSKEDSAGTRHDVPLDVAAYRPVEVLEIFTLLEATLVLEAIFCGVDDDMVVPEDIGCRRRFQCRCITSFISI